MEAAPTRKTLHHGKLPLPLPLPLSLSLPLPVLQLAAGLAAALALLPARPARANNVICDGQSDSCDCGRVTPCWCCDEHGNFGESCGNCVWWAWHEACCHWRRALPWCTNANDWDDRARANDYPMGNAPRERSIFVRNAGQWGHVGWVVRAFPDGSFDTTEMNCGGPCGVRNEHRPAGYADAGFIYDPDGQPAEVDDASFVSENLPDGSQVEAGSRVTKTWRMRNTGNTTWTRGGSYLWTFDGEERFGAPEQTLLGDGEQVPPGAEKDWSVELTMPAQPGTYRGYWKMDRFGVHRFGTRVWVELNVVPRPDEDADGDGVPASRDCDDHDTARRPGLDESCDGKDNDCDGDRDEGLSRPCSTACGQGEEHCEAGAWVGCTARMPQAEDCNGQDDDCDGQVDEELTSRACDLGCGPGTEYCEGGAWVRCSAPQPRAEDCNGQDDDCDGLTDEELIRPCSTACGDGEESCVAGQWQGCTARAPTIEECNALDDDCDGLTDEEMLLDCAGVCGSGVRLCQDGAWLPCNVPEPAPEICGNGQDEDCDGQPDDGCPCDDGGQQFCGPDRGACVPGLQRCVAGTWGPCEGARGPAPETCNGRDDDCDGATDEGLAGCDPASDAGVPDGGTGGAGGDVTPSGDPGDGARGAETLKSTGCGGCALAPGEGAPDIGGAALLIVLLLAGQRRRQ